MIDYTFHPELVNPYYGLLMNANFVDSELDSNKLTIFLYSINELTQKVENSTLVEMLHQSWRPSKVAAWIIGLRKETGLVNELLVELKNHPANAEHLIFALAFLNDMPSIKEYVLYCTSYIHDNFLHLEKLSLDWGIAALVWLDSKNGTEESVEITKPNGVLDIFYNQLEKRGKPYSLLKNQWDWKEKEKLFTKAMFLWN